MVNRRMFVLLFFLLLFSSCTIESSEEEVWSEEEIHVIIDEIAIEYDLSSWFLLAIVHRESSFNPNLINYDDGIGGSDAWNQARPECSFTVDHFPHGIGLTQLTGWMYQGSPYPYCLESANKTYRDYYYAMNIDDFGEWIDMEDVSSLEDPFDPEENLRRFVTGYAKPAYVLFLDLYGESEEETLRRVAFHWNKGLHTDYDSENTDYLERYDEYVLRYRDE